VACSIFFIPAADLQAQWLANEATRTESVQDALIGEGDAHTSEFMRRLEADKAAALLAKQKQAEEV